MSKPPRFDGASSATIPSTLAGLSEGLEWLGRWLQSHAVGTAGDNRANLIFEEVVTNIIHYGFSDGREHHIRVGARMEGEDMVLTFDDDGRPFDPRQAPEYVHSNVLEKAPIGGRGLLLVRRAARKLEYQRTGEGHNLLTVTLARG